MIEPFQQHSISRPTGKGREKKHYHLEIIAKRANLPYTHIVVFLYHYRLIFHESRSSQIAGEFVSNKKSSKQLNSWTADDENQSEQKNYTTKCEIVVVVVVLKNAPTFLLYYEIYKRIRHTTVHNTFVVEFSLSCGAVLMVDFAAVAWFFIWNSCCKWCNGTLHWKLLFLPFTHVYSVPKSVYGTVENDANE